jgi:hypothetical protein
MAAPSSCSLIYNKDEIFPSQFCHASRFDLLLELQKIQNFELQPSFEIELTAKLFYENGGEVVLPNNEPPMTTSHPISLDSSGSYFEVRFETLSVDPTHGDRKFCLRVEVTDPANWMIAPYTSPPFTVTVPPGFIFNPFAVHSRMRTRVEDPSSPYDAILEGLRLSSTAIQSHVNELCGLLPSRRI